MELIMFAQRKKMEGRAAGSGSRAAPDWKDIEERVYGPPRNVGAGGCPFAFREDAGRSLRGRPRLRG